MNYHEDDVKEAVEQAIEQQPAAQPGGKAIHVFVYGTLKQGLSNHTYHLGKYGNGTAEFVSYGKTKDSFAMYHTGGYPMVAAFPVSGSVRAPVSGEVYAIDNDCLRGLDSLEGNGSLFIRNIYNIELLDGSVLPCYMYTGVQAAWEHFTRSNKCMVTDDMGTLSWNPNRGKRNAA